jgi:hypothetical protein
MAADDDFGDLQYVDRILDPRRSGVKILIRFVGGDEISDVADDEKISRIGLDNQIGDNP